MKWKKKQQQQQHWQCIATVTMLLLAARASINMHIQWHQKHTHSHKIAHSFSLSRPLDWTHTLVNSDIDIVAKQPINCFCLFVCVVFGSQHFCLLNGCRWMKIAAFIWTSYSRTELICMNFPSISIDSYSILHFVQSQAQRQWKHLYFFSVFSM